MNISQRFQSWFISIFKKPKKEEEKPKPHKKVYCNFCGKELYITKDFFCPYCKKWHCDKHRLPEKHDCPNPKKPKGLVSGRIIYGPKGKVIYITK